MYQELRDRIAANQAEVLRMKEMELNKITDFFNQIRAAVTAREEAFRREYVNKIESQFGYFREDVNIISRVYSQIERLFNDMNQVTIVLDHMEPQGVVAQTLKVRQFADRYDHLLSTVIE